jgi:hypothetical protein
MMEYMHKWQYVTAVQNARHVQNYRLNVCVVVVFEVLFAGRVGR